MGSGDWFKTVVNLKKVKDGSSKQAKKPKSLGKSNALKSKNHLPKKSISDEIAAIRIQTAFRAYLARKMLRRLKGMVRLQNLTQRYPIRKQATSTLNHLHSWSKVQGQIRARRVFMVTEGRIKQKKLENQQKLEAKLHGIEADWCGGSETMEETLARIHERQEAAVKREKTMAYAFSHQWRANSNQIYGPGKDELGKTNWGWSWKERWIAARPWEVRTVSRLHSPKKSTIRQSSKAGKNFSSSSPKSTKIPVKVSLMNEKAIPITRRLSYPISEKKPAVHEGSVKVEEQSTKKENSVP